jgi:hypothetical protein
MSAAIRARALAEDKVKLVKALKSRLIIGSGVGAQELLQCQAPWKSVYGELIDFHLKV